MSQALSSNRLDNKNKMHKFGLSLSLNQVYYQFKLGLSKSAKASTQFGFSLIH